MSDWIEKMLNQSDEEKKLYAEIDKLRDEREKSAESVEYWEKVHDLMERIKEIRRARRTEIKRKRKVAEKIKDENALKQLREKIKKEKEEEFSRMPQSYIEAVLSYRKLNPELKRKFWYETYEQDISNIPQHENPKTTEKDISELQQVLVQDVIDFLNERGLDEVDAVRFGVDGLQASLPYGEWTPSTDSNIRLEGITTKPIAGRTIIGTYC